MKDVEFSELFNIPTQTIKQWKKTNPNDWRIKIYTYFSLKDVSEVNPDIDRIKKILESKSQE